MPSPEHPAAVRRGLCRSAAGFLVLVALATGAATLLRGRLDLVAVLFVGFGMLFVGTGAALWRASEPDSEGTVRDPRIAAALYVFRVLALGSIALLVRGIWNPGVPLGSALHLACIAAAAAGFWVVWFLLQGLQQLDTTARESTAR